MARQIIIAKSRIIYLNFSQTEPIYIYIYFQPILFLEQYKTLTNNMKLGGCVVRPFPLYRRRRRRRRCFLLPQDGK